MRGHLGDVVEMRGEKSRRMNALFAAHFAAVRAYCLRRLSVAEANDVVAEVFMVAWQKLDELPDGEATRPYLYGIARNKVAHARRRFARDTRLRSRVASQARAAAPSAEAVVMVRAEHDAVDEALASLREPDREVIRLRAWEELTAPQIALVLDISVSAAEKRIARALDRLATAVERTDSSNRPHASHEGGER